MRHRASRRFWDEYAKLTPGLRELADKSFGLLKADPQHPSLHLKKVGRFRSVRIGSRHRALAVEVDGGWVWFWIGTHSEYDRLLK